jgi:hypothetical protein
MRVAYFAVPVVIGIGAAITSCSSAPATVKPAPSATRTVSAAVSASPTASPSATSSAVPVPAGYTRIGGATAGISLAVPASWVAFNPTNGSIASGASKLGLSGISASAIEQDVASVQKLHGVIVFDVKFAVDSPQHFAPNLNAYCSSSGVTDVGAAGVPLIKQATSAEFAKLGATHVSQQNLEVGGVPGLEVSYQLDSSSIGTIYGTQLEVLPKPNTLCAVTVTVVKGVSAGSIVSTAAATAQFP